jgi:PAS domain S-box-containing protein
MKVSFANTILLGFTLCLAILSLIGFASYKVGVQYAESVSWIDHTHRVIETLDQILKDVKDAESGARGYIISNEESFLGPFHQSFHLKAEHIAKLKVLTADNPIQQNHIGRLDSLVDSKLSRLNEFIQTRKREGFNGSAFITNTGVGRQIMEKIAVLVGDMQEEERSLLKKRQNQLTINASLNRAVNVLGTLGALTMLIGLYFLLRSEMRRRNRAEAKMTKVNHFLNAILENIPNMIFVKDAPSLRFMRFNKAAEDLLGYDRKDLIGKNDYDLFPKAQATFFTDKDRATIINKEVVTIQEEPIQTRLKGERWLHTKKIPIYNEKGEPLYLLGISEDITEIKKQRDAIELHSKDLETFSYSVALDMRAPLNGINDAARILEEGYAEKPDAEGMRMLNILRSSSQTMSVLIQDLLAFGELNQQKILKKENNMNNLARSAFAKASGTVEGNKAEFLLHAVLPALGDESMINQILLILFSNASKYTSKNPKPIIEFGFLEQEGQTVYFVKDNGVGFDQKVSDKLFHVFLQLHQHAELEGTGVGLAIVDRIVTRHGGKVWAEGQAGKGATFYFTLATGRA